MKHSKTWFFVLLLLVCTIGSWLVNHRSTPHVTQTTLAVAPTGYRPPATDPKCQTQYKSVYINCYASKDIPNELQKTDAEIARECRTFVDSGKLGTKTQSFCAQGNTKNHCYDVPLILVCGQLTNGVITVVSRVESKRVLVGYRPPNLQKQ
jgi:hypothetical protein